MPPRMDQEKRTDPVLIVVQQTGVIGRDDEPTMKQDILADDDDWTEESSCERTSI